MWPKLNSSKILEGPKLEGLYYIKRFLIIQGHYTKKKFDKHQAETLAMCSLDLFGQESRPWLTNHDPG